MFPKLKVSRFLLKRIVKVKQQCTGCLFGIMYEGSLLLLGFNIESTIGQVNYKEIQYKFPAEIDLCGFVVFGDCADDQLDLNKVLQDVDITDNPIVLNCPIGTLVDLKASISMHGKLQDIPYEIVEDEELYRDFSFTRIRCYLRLFTDENVDAIKQDMQKLRKRLADGGLGFRVNNTKIYLLGSKNGTTTSISSHTKISELLNNINGAGDNVTHGKLSKKQKSLSNSNNSGFSVNNNSQEYEVIDIQVIKNRTKDPSSSENPLAAPLINMKENVNKLCIPLNLDAMAILYKNTKIIGLYDILIESICRSLRLIEKTLVDAVRSGMELAIPRTYHFFVPDFGHFLSCVYLENCDESNQEIMQNRKKLHHNFALPLTRPYFRRANKYVFKEDLIGQPLVNTHIGLKPSGVRDGQQYLVQGKYSYYHYMQQKFDDNGWGCAYRSLQTLCSWFRWQGYTERSIPTHEEIQKYLVEIGDKPRNFIGSRQWIGSTEVSMCLSGFLNVDSRILHVSSGSELSSKGSELAMHFESQGTPIMIGGGVLAHTIIGIDFNSTTGNIKFLILDPHYTDADDLHIIQGKGWCGWKGPDFWDKRSYYNLCMPQRPATY